MEQSKLSPKAIGNGLRPSGGWELVRSCAPNERWASEHSSSCLTVACVEEFIIVVKLNWKYIANMSVRRTMREADVWVRAGKKTLFKLMFGPVSRVGPPHPPLT
jgi:hypothetical protein